MPRGTGPVLCWHFIDGGLTVPAVADRRAACFKIKHYSNIVLFKGSRP
jgi:hypothetical protein